MTLEIGPSQIETNFVLESLQKGLRVDGRGPNDLRQLRLTCGPALGMAEVQLGQTRVLARVSCQPTRPYPDRPSEGLVSFNTEFSRPDTTGQEIAISRMLEKVLKQSRAIDTESLCIIAGEQVWSVHLDLHFLDHSGNLTDASLVAAVVALKHFRRPDVTIDGDQAIIHDPRDRNPVPLSILHVPLSVTFGFFGPRAEWTVVDPTVLEEQIQTTSLTVCMNANGEICMLSKAGGLALAPEQIQWCTRAALEKVDQLNDKIKQTLQ